MKFEYAPSEAYGWAEVTATPTDFDGHPPLPAMRMLWPIGDANVDRIAIASSLIFAPWMAGLCDYGRPFSALTGQRITEWFQTQDIWVSPSPIRMGGLTIPRGHQKIHLGDTIDSADASVQNLRFVSSLEGSGQNGQSVQVACNLDALIGEVPNIADRYAMTVGAAVLVAESLSANEIVYPEYASVSPEEFSATARLLECVSLGLRNE